MLACNKKFARTCFSEVIVRHAAGYITLRLASAMLLLGTCNPSGERAQYNGLYYTADELAALVQSNALHGVPVKTEHTGNEIGRVVSGFLDASGALQCVMEVDEGTLEGAIASGFVRDGVAADLSLGYSVDVQHTDDRLKAGAKKMLEISIVRKGARKGCHIHAYQTDNAEVVFKSSGADRTWDCFEL